MAMKTRRTSNRREFRVGTVGWFTVLKPDPFELGSLTARSKQVGRDRRNGRQEPTTTPSMTQLFTDHPNLKRTALIVSAAMTMTAALLWWIMHP
jgi:hypothetical protein